MALDLLFDRSGHIVERVLGPVVDAVGNLALLGITHRGIRPSNLFPRAGTAREFALGDFLSGPLAAAQPAVFETVESAMCLPSGFPSGMLYILPIQIVMNPKYMVIIPELQRAARIIPTDGRPHREGLEPTYYGDSVGKWEGDTLVIDSVNFKRWILDDYHYTDPTKTRWHSDALHTVERLRRDGDKLLYQITIDDPKIFTKPFSQDFELTLRKDWEQLGLLEYVCEENNRCAGGTCKPSQGQK